MGIIKASMAALSGASADQWKEVFICGGMGSDVLIRRASRQTSQNSANQGSNNVITEGSVIIVGEGECAIVTENGKIVGVYDQPGEQIFSGEKGGGFFTGGMRAFAKDVGRRISFGGDAPFFHRLLYINTKELPGNTFSVGAVPFHFRDARAGIDVDGSLSCSGAYSFRITDPELFYKAYARSAVDKSRQQLLKQMDSELLTALGPVLEAIFRDGVRPSELPQYAGDFGKRLRHRMSEEWRKLRGIEACSVAIESILTADGAMIRTAQRDTTFLDPVRAAAHLVGAVSDAAQIAAENTSGALPMTPVLMQDNTGQSGSWTCACGHKNKGKFCEECGAARPAGWICGCGMENKGRFCTNCGNPRT